MTQQTKPTFESKDIPSANISALAQLFPSCINESRGEDGKLKQSVDFDKLRTLLGGDIALGDESYDFTWVGKKAAIQEAGIPVRKTLRPVVEDEGIPTGADSSGKPYCSTGSKNWDTTQNVYIEGDNLDVLKLLQESYLKKVKMIYIDPPYNTGNDFIYKDHFEMDEDEYDEGTGAVDDSGIVNFKQNNDANPRFHSDWCSMMYPRLVLARNLLTDDGVIFIHIDDREVTQLRKICAEILGECNYLAEFPRVTKKGGKSSDVTAKNHDYILFYAKNILQADLIGISHTDSGYSNKDEFFEERGYYKVNQTLDYDSLGYVQTLDYPIKIGGETFYAGGDLGMYNERQQGQHGRADWGWRWSKDLFDFGLAKGFIEIHRGGTRPRIYTKTYQNVSIEKMGRQYQIVRIDRTKPLSTLEFIDNKYSNDNAKKVFDAIMQKGIFEYTKPPELILQLVHLVNGNDFSVLDFFSGSATAAHAVMQLNAEDGGNRKFIMVQLPEVCAEGSEAAKAGYKNICDIGKERIRRAGDKIIAELKMRTAESKKKNDPQLSLSASDADNSELNSTHSELDIGFRVFKVDDSNMKDVYYSAEETKQQMLSGLESNIKEDRTDMDLLYGCMLDWGLPLSLPHSTETLDGVTVHTVDSGALIACFDANIPESAIRIIAQRKPLRVVFRDSSFATSPEKINVTEIFKTISPNTGVKVI
jgi:Adenine specific DNA methylase Mod